MRPAYMALWALFSSLEPVIAKDIEIHAPEKAPPGISKPVEHDFASFSFPVHFFADYAGTLPRLCAARGKLIPRRK